jgi:hypothetical protein
VHACSLLSVDFNLKVNQERTNNSCRDTIKQSEGGLLVCGPSDVNADLSRASGYYLGLTATAVSAY